jgi:hypothetical protein
MPLPGSQELSSFIEHQAEPPTEIRKAIPVDQVTGKEIVSAVQKLSLMQELALAKDLVSFVMAIKGHTLGTSWKTSLLGSGGLVAVLVKVLSDYLSHTPIDLSVVVPEVFAAIGLMMAKDSGVSGK